MTVTSSLPFYVWRGPPSPHHTEPSFTPRIEDDAKQKLRHALGETQGEAGGIQIIKEYHVSGRLLSLLRSTFDVGAFRPFTSFRKRSRGRHFLKKKRRSSKLTPRDADGVDGGGDGEAREKLLRRECRLESTTGPVVEDGEEMRKPLRQELEQAPHNLQAHIHTIVMECRVDVNSEVSPLRSGVGTLYQRIVSVLPCFFCMSSSHSTSASGENVIGHDDTKSDQQRREEARLQRSIIQLKRKEYLSDVDPTNLVTTVFQCTDQSASILDTPVGMPPAEVITNIESEAVAEEMIILDLGGGGVLGGLSFLGYENVVFSMCPASLVDTDIN